MPLDLTQLVFPNNAVELIATRFELIDPVAITVLRRGLRTADPNLSIGVAGSIWRPVPGSYEMSGVDHTHNPSLESYMIQIEVMCKYADEQQGLIAHSVLAETVRTILAADRPLRTQLGGLTASLNGVTKTLQRWYPQTTRYHSTKLDGGNLYAAITDVILETETTSG